MFGSLVLKFLGDFRPLFALFKDEGGNKPIFSRLPFASKCISMFTFSCWDLGDLANAHGIVFQF